MNTTLQSLVRLSRQLGEEERELAILGEGNTSADCADGTFWVKASGNQLGRIDESGFSRVRLASVLELLDVEQLTDGEVKRGLEEAVVAADHDRPSVETFLHALCLTEGEAGWVAHTHPTAVNRILCSGLGAEPFLNHIFPDAIVVCGREPAVVPYVDPGLRLAQMVRTELQRYRKRHHQPPRLLLLVNHGVVALGASANEVWNITLMVDKWARILHGTYALGGPSFLPSEEAARIDNRPDEHYRRGRLGAGQAHQEHTD